MSMLRSRRRRKTLLTRVPLNEWLEKRKIYFETIGNIGSGILGIALAVIGIWVSIAANQISEIANEMAKQQTEIIQKQYEVDKIASLSHLRASFQGTRIENGFIFANTGARITDVIGTIGLQFEVVLYDENEGKKTRRNFEFHSLEGTFDDNSQIITFLITEEADTYEKRRDFFVGLEDYFTKYLPPVSPYYFTLYSPHFAFEISYIVDMYVNENGYVNKTIFALNDYFSYWEDNYSKTSSDPGRAIQHFGEPTSSVPDTLPFGYIENITNEECYEYIVRKMLDENYEF